jgi:nucleotidyltransferase substrate binding protein (TIGR01987 family)
MNGRNAKLRLENLGRAIERLEEAVAAPADTPFIVDATIQRFEFAFELCWKAIKGFLELETSSADLGTARAVLKTSYTAGWIDDEDGWNELFAMRNATSHVYNEAMARDIYRRIGTKMPMMRKALIALRAKSS